METYEPYIDANSEYYICTPSATAKQLFFYVTQIGFYHYKPNYTLKRNNFHSFLLMLISDGECDLSLSGICCHASKGQLVLIDCYSPHQYKSSWGWKALWIHFDGPLARTYYEYLSHTCGNVITPADFHMVHQEMHEILNMFQTDSIIPESQVSQKLTCILNSLVDLSPCDTAADSVPVKDSISYINKHFSKPITLKDLSERVCLSPFYFTRIFAKETGMTPHQYLISTRISAARFLLKSTSLSIKEIGYQCGFPSESNFCSTFKKWEHQTPSSYRNHI